jgi:hypothetical protein
MAWSMRKNIGLVWVGLATAVLVACNSDNPTDSKKVPPPVGMPGDLVRPSSRYGDDPSRFMSLSSPMIGFRCVCKK